MSPRLGFDDLDWLFRFVAHCSARSAAAGLASMLDLNTETGLLFDTLGCEAPTVELEKRGVLLVYERRESFEKARKALEHSDRFPAHVLGPAETARVEPSVLPDRIVGAILRTEDRHVRPESLVVALAELFARYGGETREHTPCVNLLHNRGFITGARTRTGVLTAAQYVLAIGAELRSFGKGVGLRLPIMGARGYSYEVPSSALPLQRPIYLYDSRIAATPFQAATRVAGILEIGAGEASSRGGAIEAMHHATRHVLRVAVDASIQNRWSGLRPLTPDGLPLIGRPRSYQNLFVAGGHGMLGVTLSLRTGTAITGILSGVHDPALTPFRPDRFDRRRVGVA